VDIGGTFSALRLFHLFEKAHIENSLFVADLF